MLKVAAAALVILLCLSVAAIAGEADVVKVRAEQVRKGVWDFTVTVRHDDDGWHHYADRWEVLDPEGSVLGTRVLLHPHVGEQPFTRGLSGVRIPSAVERVVVPARDSVHGYGGEEVEVKLPGN